MTYRTILSFTPTHPATRDLMGDFHTAHQMVMSGFAHLLPGLDMITGADGQHPDHRASLHILHAVQTRPTGVVQVLVQSDQPGKWDHQSWADALTQTPYTAEPTLVTEGKVRYQLTFNPVYNQSRTGKKLPLRGTTDIVGWWTKRAEDRGLHLVGDPTLLRTTELRSPKRKRDLTAATVQGVATVTNAEALRRSIVEGVGRGRAYGCGILLTQSA